MILSRLSPAYAPYQDEQLVVTLLRSGPPVRLAPSTSKWTRDDDSQVTSHDASHPVISHHPSHARLPPTKHAALPVQHTARQHSSGKESEKNARAGGDRHVSIATPSIFDVHGHHSKGPCTTQQGNAQGMALSTTDIKGWGEGSAMEHFASMSFLWGVPLQDSAALELYNWKSQVLYACNQFAVANSSDAIQQPTFKVATSAPNPTWHMYSYLACCRAATRSVYLCGLYLLSSCVEYDYCVAMRCVAMGYTALV